MNVHICALDKECRNDGIGPAIWRLYVHLGDWHLIVALRPSAKSQAWYPHTGWTKKWRWVTLSPSASRYCGEPVYYRTGRSGQERPVVCSRLQSHRGEHRAPVWP